MGGFKRAIRIFSYVIGVLAISGLVLCMVSDDTLEVNRINTKNSKITSGESLKAIVISDYHHRELNFKNGDLISKVKNEKPDAIFFTGDMVDTHTKNLDDLTKMFDAFENTQMFYVTGNHEQYAPLWTNGSVKNLMEDKGVNYLGGNDTKNLWKDIADTNIRVFGVDDPKFSNPNEPYFGKNYGNLESLFKKLKDDGVLTNSKCNILLAHRPELMDLYTKYGFDYVICGHTHGGQIKLFNAWTPISIGQGFGPKYVAGTYKEKDTTMYVTKGLGHSAMLPIRVHCNPEILSITFSNI